MTQRGCTWASGAEPQDTESKFVKPCEHLPILVLKYPAAPHNSVFSLRAFGDDQESGYCICQKSVHVVVTERSIEPENEATSIYLL